MWRHGAGGHGHVTRLLRCGKPAPMHRAGRYMITLEVSSVQDASLYSVELLVVPVEVLPCAPGYTLDTSLAALNADATPSSAGWLGCEACGFQTVGLWRDDRAALQGACLCYGCGPGLRSCTEVREGLPSST
jgi:hypothetical protein